MQDFIILHEQVECDDNTLVRMYNSACNELRRRKNLFDKERKSYDENNYLNYAVTRLAYEFAKGVTRSHCNQ